MKTLAAIATAMMLFAVPAFGQSLIGEWKPVKAFCEGGKVLKNYQKTNSRWIFDEVSATNIRDLSHFDEHYKTTGCALHVKMNYSISVNQYKVGPFLEMLSPKCPDHSKQFEHLVKYSIGTLKENGLNESFINAIMEIQKIKEGNASPISFKISDNNQQMWLFNNDPSTYKHCSSARYGVQYKRIK